MLHTNSLIQVQEKCQEQTSALHSWALGRAFWGWLDGIPHSHCGQGLPDGIPCSQGTPRAVVCAVPGITCSRGCWSPHTKAAPAPRGGGRSLPLLLQCPSSLNLLQPVHGPGSPVAGKQLSSFLSKTVHGRASPLHSPLSCGPWVEQRVPLEMLINKSYLGILAVLKSDVSASIEGLDKDLPLELWFINSCVLQFFFFFIAVKSISLQPVKQRTGPLSLPLPNALFGINTDWRSGRVNVFP